MTKYCAKLSNLNLKKTKINQRVKKNATLFLYNLILQSPPTIAITGYNHIEFTQKKTSSPQSTLHKTFEYQTRASMNAFAPPYPPWPFSPEANSQSSAHSEHKKKVETYPNFKCLGAPSVHLSVQKFRPTLISLLSTN